MPPAPAPACKQYYDLPSPSLRNALYHDMRADVAPWRVSRVRTAGQTTPAGLRLKKADDFLKQFFYHDNIHPGDTGHQALAELLAGVVQTAVKAVAEAALREEGAAAALARGTGSSSEDGGGGDEGAGEAKPKPKPKLPGLPPPMIPGNVARATSMCAMQVRPPCRALGRAAAPRSWLPRSACIARRPPDAFPCLPLSLTTGGL